jgi:hypothetical protein
MELQQKKKQWALALFQGEPIRTEVLLSMPDLEHVKAFGWIRLQKCRDLIVRQMMPMS